MTQWQCTISFLAALCASYAFCAEQAAPSRYSPNNQDESMGVVSQWIAEAERFKEAKLSLIKSGKIVIDHRSSIPRPTHLVNLPSAEWTSLNGEEAKLCGFYFAIPPNSEGGGCEKKREVNGPAGQAPEWNSTVRDSFNWVAGVSIPIRKRGAKGYAFDEYFSYAKFIIIDDQSFEQRLLESPQVGAGKTGLFANKEMYPNKLWNRLPPNLVVVKNNEGTQLLVARIDGIGDRVSGRRPLYSTCIYSIHGNSRRSAEALTCFMNIDGYKNNPYIERYMKILDSIRMD
ncbi:hypothetical protein [Ralstonia sp. ASV6]|uniref:hypothetical protein n=1 Tax=Ralstonia sp. ASV6 TaxID=2795124 RepID=UPI0018EDB8F8|nr:hypothetical protein [Ralstonia sp. ASV6]